MAIYLGVSFCINYPLISPADVLEIFMWFMAIFYGAVYASVCVSVWDRERELIHYGTSTMLKVSVYV